MHEHTWYLTLGPGRWTAACACGLAVAVEEPAPGRSRWAWTRHGETPPAAVLLEAIESVTSARRALLADPAGRN
jgi:hypothetical protein